MLTKFSCITSYIIDDSSTCYSGLNSFDRDIIVYRVIRVRISDTLFFT